MSLFGSLMGDVEDDPFFGPHMRHMQQMNNFMNSMFSGPFGMLNEGPLAIGGARHGGALMPFMPHMPMNNMFSANMANGPLTSGSSFSSSTVVMSSGPNGAPQVFSSTSRTKIGPNGVKETQKTLQDSRTGVKKMSIGHHIGERAHVIEREQNVYSGDAEERQEFINLDEEEAEEFDKEFQHRSGMHAAGPSRRALTAPAHAAPAPRLALPAPPAPAAEPARAGDRVARHRPSARRPIRPSTTLTDSSGVREVYGGAHPQRQKPRHRSHRNH